MLLKGSKWQDALYLASIHLDRELIESVVVPGLRQGFTQLLRLKHS